MRSILKRGGPPDFLCVGRAEIHRRRIRSADEDADALVRRRHIGAARERGERRGGARFGDDARAGPQRVLRRDDARALCERRRVGAAELQRHRMLRRIEAEQVRAIAPQHRAVVIISV